MRYLLSVAALLLSVRPIFATEPLPSRLLDLPIAVVQNGEPLDFDLIDFRAQQRVTVTPRGERPPHSMFGIKTHVGFAAGYDYGIVHGSIGLYLTVAEWGRWNFGIPSPEIGIGRYRQYDGWRRTTFLKNDPSIFVSLASVHYRVGYLQSVGLHWYINLEQMFDVRQNMAGSQVGLSFSTK